MAEFKKINCSSLFIEPKHLAGPGWTKKPKKSVSKASESTYNAFSKANESKMPGSSSVRSLLRRSLKLTRNEIETSIQDWLNLMPHCSPPLDSFDSSSLDWKVAWLNQTRTQLLKMQLDRAEPSRRARVSQETKTCLRN